MDIYIRLVSFVNRLKLKFGHPQYVDQFSESHVSVRKKVEFSGIHRGSVVIETGSVFVVTGQIIGDVFAVQNSELVVFGEVEGQIITAGRVLLKRNCHIKGQITAKELSIDEGVRFDGKATVISSETQIETMMRSHSKFFN